MYLSFSFSNMGNKQVKANYYINLNVLELYFIRKKMRQQSDEPCLPSFLSSSFLMLFLWIFNLKFIEYSQNCKLSALRNKERWLRECLCKIGPFESSKQKDLNDTLSVRLSHTRENRSNSRYIFEKVRRSQLIQLI